MKKEKNLGQRLQQLPKDMSYKELETILRKLGLEEGTGGKTSGSRVKFVNQATGHRLCFHRPHGSDPMKVVTLREIIAFLTEEGVI